MENYEEKQIEKIANDMEEIYALMDMLIELRKTDKAIFKVVKELIEYKLKQARGEIP